MSKRLLVSVLALALAGAACGDDNNESNNTPTNNAGTDAGTDDADSGVEPFSEDCTTMIVPSTNEDAAAAAEENRQNITTALVEPSEGDVICLGDGTYNLTEQLTLNASNVSNIEIRGQSQDGTILDFDGQDGGANGILVDGIDDIRVADLTIKNTAGDGIKIQNGDGVEMVNLTVTWDGGPNTSNGAYGVYPVLNQNVLVEGCDVSYASDAGIYVGQSNTVIARNNVAYGNVAGLEIENTTNAEVHDNHLYENTGGLLIFNLPGLQVKEGGNNIVRDNLIENNNQVNFAEAGTIVSLVPQGVGLLLLATDNNEIYNNEVKDNQSIGLGIASYFITGEDIEDPEYDPFSESNFIHDNTFENNGYQPVELAAALNGGNPVPSMLVDGVFNPELPDGTTWLDVRDCFDANVTEDGSDADFLNFNYDSSDAPADITDCSTEWTDFCHYQCTYDPLPSVTLE
ncbi:hypothetical protein FIV42_21510 [Persicimonas caeni]|uniref:Right handed beta helix domain-containing protein n=1 Tax=Persicimonas caeni TaxID=2292766 RepID=A0A4Y6PYB8_PERCE|nr:parallel beta-helix domain-containing protein [Persicimonas caeni]QDG53230.1 hypothetical protein FIV42_21510 [Persicimonas caeni]QED34452.1 hypothetical protein FRD00_21505 [Persicimonas caeni]